MSVVVKDFVFWLMILHLEAKYNESKLINLISLSSPLLKLI